MSQRECAGFNRPGFAVSADEPLGIGPESTSVACKLKLVNEIPIAAPFWTAFALRIRNCSTVPPASCAAGVAHDASSTCPGSFSVGLSWLPPLYAYFLLLLPPVRLILPPRASCARAVGNEVKPLSEVRRADPRSAQIGRPDGVTHSFQVSRYSVEPRPSSRARNLLSKDDRRATLADEPEPCGPEVSLVPRSLAPSGNAEGLAGTAPGPNRDSSRPLGELECVLPETNSGEGVEASTASCVVCREVADVLLDDSASGEVPGGDESSKPRAGVSVEVVVDELSVK